ncbi:hypothetical protein BVY04_05025 [bacterium M21]|nr:hypothetical protein BVY04_05025 [bacterium M21]
MMMTTTSKAVLTLSITGLLLSVVGMKTFANETEVKLQNTLETRVQKLTVSINQLKKFQAAFESTDSDREAVLRKICARMKAETRSVGTAVGTLDTYLEIQSFEEQDQVELNRTHKNIHNLKSEIEQLKRSLGSAETASPKVAAF